MRTWPILGAALLLAGCGQAAVTRKIPRIPVEHVAAVNENPSETIGGKGKTTLRKGAMSTERFGFPASTTSAHIVVPPSRVGPPHHL